MFLASESINVSATLMLSPAKAVESPFSASEKLYFMYPRTSSFQQCQSCGKQIKSGFLFCPQCGTNLPTDASVPQHSPTQRLSNRISNKTIGVIAIGMFALSLLLSTITANNQQAVKPSITPDSPSSAWVEPSPSPSIEISQPKPGRKHKASSTKSEAQAKKDESITSKPARIATYSPPTTKQTGYMTGPRGGCYYINGNGNKTYVDRSLCGSSYSYGSSSVSRGGYITGPRGGCYYINRNGNKTYVDHSLCR